MTLRSFIIAKPLVPNALWDRIKPLLPATPTPKWPDRPRRHLLDDSRAMVGIFFALKTAINWEDLPAEMGCGSGMTCWRRLDEWTRGSVWARLHELLPVECEYAGRIDWSIAAEDSSRVRDQSVERRKKRSKHHVVVDGGVRDARQGLRREGIEGGG